MTSLHGYYVDRGGDVHEADVYAFENIWTTTDLLNGENTDFFDVVIPGVDFHVRLYDALVYALEVLTKAVENARMEEAYLQDRADAARQMLTLMESGEADSVTGRTVREGSDRA